MPPQRTKDENSASRSTSPAAPNRTRLDHRPTLASVLQLVEAGCLLSEFDVARITGLAVRTLRQRRLHKQEPRHIKLGRSVRYDPRDVAAFIEAGRQPLPRDPALP
jgi:hypothetical protein